ncbi:MAG: purine-nucleoside phosphorylase, partial [Bdellovibrionaceae bacterium]|nr:purine-nucleoside phosphorylase [Pseudobdellovibrionaceae bacterium]
MEPKILFSACLLGQKVRYDGDDVLTDHPAIKEWTQKGLLISICPEVAGGLPVPRPPAEIQQ